MTKLSLFRDQCRNARPDPSLALAAKFASGASMADGRSRHLRGRILPFNGSTATSCAAMHGPNPRSDPDAMIAATALAHGMTVVTRIAADFADTGVQLINPFG